MISKLREAREKEEGFTLIELLVVVIIIGILAAIAIPAFLNQRERAWQAELQSTVRNLAIEIEAEATKFGGDYTKVLGTTTTTFAGFVDETLTTLQGAAATPVDVVGQAAAATNFCVVASHVQLGVTATSPQVVYDSDGGGLQDYDENGGNTC